jgi:hypothetical protein
MNQGWGIFAERRERKMNEIIFAVKTELGDLQADWPIQELISWEPYASG